MTYNVYLDKYGYAIGVKEVEAPDNYVFITGIDTNESNLKNGTLTAAAIFLDGTMKTISVDMGKSRFNPDLTATGADAVLNTWCTYSVNNSDVYTVTQITGDLATDGGKVGQYKSDPANNIDDTHIWLAGATTSGSPYYRVYGNDATVYLTASVNEINKAGTKNATIIDDVVSTTVGVDNVNIEPWNETKALAEAGDTDSSTASPATGNGWNSHGAYVLYNDDAYIIGAVVVGEDAGSASNFVYVHSGSLAEESYDKAEQEYTWLRDVISNGEKITLKEVNGDGVSLLEAMDANQWYQVRTNADGEVTRVTASKVSNEPDYDNSTVIGNWNLNSHTGITRYTYTLDTDCTDTYPAVPSTPNANARYGAAELVEKAEVKTILYHEEFGVIAGKPTVDKNRTLWEYNSRVGGVRIEKTTKVVLDQERNNDGGDVYYYDGHEGVVEALDQLNTYPVGNANAGKYNYDLSMVIEDGRVTSVVIKDRVPDGDAGTTTTRSGDTFVNTVANATKIYYIWDNSKMGAAPSENDMFDDIVAKLEEEGYTVGAAADPVTKSGSVYSFPLYNSRGVKVATRTWDASAGVLAGSVVTINSKAYLVDESNTTIQAIVRELGWVSGVDYFGDGVKMADGSFVAWATASGIDLNDNGDDNADAFSIGTTAATGYYAFAPTGNSWTPVVGTYPNAVQPGQSFTMNIEKNLAGNWDETNLATVITNGKFTTNAPTKTDLTPSDVKLVTKGTGTAKAVVSVKIEIASTITTGPAYVCP